MKKGLKMSLISLMVVLAASLVFVACPQLDEIEGAADDARAVGQTTQKWTFSDSPTGLTNGATISTDITYTNGMTLLGKSRSFTWSPTMASPGSPATAGAMKVGGKTASGVYFLKIDGVQGPFKITLNYASNGDSSRYAEIFVGTKSVKQGAASASKKLVTDSYSYTGTDSVTVQLGCSDAINLFDVELVKSVYVSSVAIKEGNFSLAAKATKQLSTTVLPAEATQSVTWSSSSTSVATVSSSGLVTGVAAGTATITATASDGSGKKGTVTATVTATSSSSTPAATAPAATTPAATATRKWTFVDKDSNGKLVDYSSNSTVMKEDIAYLDSMTLLGSQRDFRWIPKQSSPGSSASAGCIQTGGATSSGKYFLKIDNVKGPFTITANYTGTSSSSDRYVEIFVGGSSKLKGGTTNEALKSASYSYTGTDSVTVQLGCGGGAVRLYDVSIGGSSSSGGTTTTPTTVAVTGVSVSGGGSVTAGSTKALTVAITPSNATNQSVTWSSSDTSIATVSSSGVVTAVKAGSATITAKAADGSGKSGTASITVTAATAATVAVTGVSVSGGGSMTAGTTKTLSVTITPSNATNKAVTWSSSSTGVATVNSSGLVTAVAAGTATITATSQASSSVKGTATITVTAASSGGGTTGGGTTGGGTVTGSGSVSIKEAKGWLEALYVTWGKVSGASAYTVEYQKSGGSWIKIDNQLIREYSGSTFRADVVGLSSGTYSVRVATSGSTSYATASNISVKAHDRSGFAHYSGSTHKTGSGAYNDDGTLKSGAKVIYITAKSAKTVKLSVAESASKTTECTGISEILAKRQKGYDKTPLAIRIVGTVDISNISDQLGSNTLLQVKGKAGKELMNVTVEGIGNDATAYGWGILVRAAGNVEVRNIGFMMFPEDGVSLDTDNQNIWVHNNDFFYGKDGGGDKNKGDGALDSKKSGYVTMSYNHFWDSGKCNLLGNGTEDPEKLTYHHNWYDHSDSRHPRVRFHSAHVYNNYYDGVAKYGVGATCGSSIFVEANYFRNTKNPMAISLQGSDTQYGAKSDSDGSFSKEDGGMIKAYNNYMDSFSAGYYKAYSSSNTVQFDAYEAARGTSVPSSVKTKAGSKTYNNFDSSMYSYTAESATTAKSTVETYAGRMQGKSGADFSWNFSSSDDTDSARNSSLDSAIKAYKTKVVAIQGN